MKKVTIRVSEEMCQEIREDLGREHLFAFERVGYAIGKSKELNDNEVLIIINDYVRVEDQDYIEDSSVGARINSDAIRMAMQIAMDNDCSIFHIHEHFGNGTPEFGSTDMDELPGIVDAMINANSSRIHGLLLLSEDGINAFVKMKPSKGLAVLNKVVRVGYPMSFNKAWYFDAEFDVNRYGRQSFLGEWSQHILSKITVGVIGLGGGGSHIVQQLAHLGVRNFVLFDNDVIEDSNLNRLISGTIEDVELEQKKTEISIRQIKKLQPNATIVAKDSIWQKYPNIIESCDVVFGAVDTFLNRRDIELECRRYLIPYIDIGMDVRTVDPDPPRLFGQIILSMPGNPCMSCIGYLTEDLLSKEAEKYGDAGSQPQVVWSNGVLASNSVGIFVDMITGWSKQSNRLFYQEYDGNNIALIKSYRLNYLKNKCEHFPSSQAGPVKW